MSAEQRLADHLARLGLSMPPAPEPKGLYRPMVQVADFVYTAGHLPMDAEGRVVTGRVGQNLDLAAAQHAARLATLGILATLRHGLGSLDRVRRLVKLLGVVRCTDDFTQQPAVLNAASQLLAEVFGPEAGVGARTALGTHALPLDAALEIESIFQIE